MSAGLFMLMLHQFPDRQFFTKKGFDRMNAFQILNDKVIIIKGSKTYMDSVQNFMLDAQTTLSASKVIYDDQQKCCVVDDVFKTYPDTTYDGYITAIDATIAAKAKREYVAPTVDELRQQALSYQYTQYLAKRDAIVWVDKIGYACDEDAQRKWQLALTLIGDSETTKLKVYTSETVQEIKDITKAQMLDAGEAAKTQQLGAYSDFEAVKDKINSCTSAADVQAYLQP
jgi:hypothetical protein